MRVDQGREGSMPLSWFCPMDCAACWDSGCVADGCKRTAQPVLAACDDCGTLFLAGVVSICRDCVFGSAVEPERRLGTGKSAEQVR